MELTKSTDRFANELVKYFDIDDESIKLLEPEYSAGEYLEKLIENKFYLDAIHLLSLALPKREAIWWACICAKYHEQQHNDEIYNAGIKAAENWVYDPSEKNRRIAEYYAEQGNYETAASWSAAAAFWAGGSITAEGEPTVEPAPYLYAHAVSGAIIMAVGMTETNDINEVYHQYLQHGINIANGGNG